MRTTEQTLALYARVRVFLGRNCAVRVMGNRVEAWGVPRLTNGPPQWCDIGAVNDFEEVAT